MMDEKEIEKIPRLSDVVTEHEDTDNEYISRNSNKNIYVTINDLVGKELIVRKIFTHKHYNGEYSDFNDVFVIAEDTSSGEKICFVARKWEVHKLLKVDELPVRIGIIRAKHGNASIR